MTPLLNRPVEDLLLDIIRRLDRIEDHDNRYVILPVMQDLWRLLIDIQTRGRLNDQS